MTVLSANGRTDVLVDQDLRMFTVGAAQHIYRGSIVGIDPAGNLKTFVPGDRLVGISYEEFDNSSGSAGAVHPLSGAVGCQVRVKGDFVFTLSSAALTDYSAALYATDDATIAKVGHPDAYIGRVLHKGQDASNQVVFRMKQPGEEPLRSDRGSMEVVSHFIHPTAITIDVDDAAEQFQLGADGLIIQSTAGLAHVHADSRDGGAVLGVDVATEVAQASIETMGMFAVAGGITFECKIHNSDNGDDALLNTSWGLATKMTDSVRLDFETAADLAAFHLGGNAAAIFVHSDDQGVAEIALVDSTKVNVETANAFKLFKVICRPSGVCEFWIDNVRILPSTVFAMTAGAVDICGVINVEKESNDTLGQVDIDFMRVAGAHS